MQSEWLVDDAEAGKLLMSTVKPFPDMMLTQTVRQPQPLFYLLSCLFATWKTRLAGFWQFVPPTYASSEYFRNFCALIKTTWLQSYNRALHKDSVVHLFWAEEETYMWLFIY